MNAYEAIHDPLVSQLAAESYPSALQLFASKTILDRVDVYAFPEKSSFLVSSFSYHFSKKDLFWLGPQSIYWSSIAMEIQQWNLGATHP